MPGRYPKLLQMLLSELIACWQRPQCEKLLIESAFLITQKHCNELKQAFWQHKFTDNTEEICFFKHIHPQFGGRMLYYSIVYESLLSCPSCCESTKIFWLKELDRYNRFRSHHENLVNYLDTNCTEDDERYFLRGTGDRIVHVHEKVQFMCTDEATIWSTSAAMYFAEKSYHQYVLSKVDLFASPQSYVTVSAGTDASRK
jgi:hypothetical protein